MLLGAQIVHIDEGEGKLTLYSTKHNGLVIPLPPAPSQLIDSIYFYFYFPSTTSTVYRPFIDPTTSTKNY